MVELVHSTNGELKTNFQKNNKEANHPDVPCPIPLDETRLQDILENIPSAVLVFEKPTGKIIYANKRAIELYGQYPCGIPLRKQMHVLKFYSMIGQLCSIEELYIYRTLFNGETVCNEPAIIERSDKERFIVNINARPLFDQDGKVNGAIAVFDDVTESMQTQEALLDSEDRLNMAQRIAHLGSWEYFVKEDRAVWSDELFNIFGLPHQKYGPNVNDYLNRIHPEDRPRIEKLMLRGGLGALASFDYRIVRKDGTVRVIHSERMVREHDEKGNPSRIMGVEQDITERKQTEAKLAQYAKNLEQLVEERTTQLKNVERLAAIGQTAGMIGHDIRNPLQAIAGELYLMKADVDSSPDSECKRDVQESLASIQDQVDYINKIIADLQDFARPLKPEKNEVNLCSAIPQLVTTVKVPSNITLRTDCDETLPMVKVDLVFLKRVLVNLVTNAIQAMPDGGKVTITTTHTVSNVIITVADTGIGIPDAIKPKIFQPLMTTKSKGQGLGLAVVKRLVEAQGGTITFKSQVGEGTEFRVTFPKAT